MTTPLVGEPPGWSVPSWGPSDWQVSVRHEARGGCSGPPGRGAGALRHAEGAKMTPDQGWNELRRCRRPLWSRPGHRWPGWTSTWEPQEWGRPPPAPAGASRDQFPHLIGIERMLLAETAPTWNEPLGEHVKNDLAASHERGWPCAPRSRGE